MRFETEALTDYLTARLTGRAGPDTHPQAAMLVRDGVSLRDALERTTGVEFANPHVFARTITHSDMGWLLSNALNAVVAGDVGHDAHRPLCATLDLPNLKPTGISTVHVGDVSEIPYTMSGVSERQPPVDMDESVTATMRLFTAGLRVSRVALVNDDVGTIAAAALACARALRRAEAKAFAETLEGAELLADGSGLFTASNTSGTTGAPSVDTLKAAAALLRTQEILGAKTDASLSAILVPPAQEATAWVLAEALGKRFEVRSSPWLSGAAWYAFASPQEEPAIVRLRYLGRDAPVAEQRKDPLHDGMAYVFEHFAGFRPVSRAGVVKVTI